MTDAAGDRPGPLADHPLERSAILLDVDGTIAPIVGSPEDASVPLEVRHVLVDLARRSALVACVSGRTAADARRVVGVAAITYIGGHGSELLEPGMASAETDPQLDLWGDPVNDLAIEAMRELSPLGVRREEKGPIAALHWRGASDEESVVAALERYSAIAEARGLAVHWGRKVLEFRPPVDFDKGRGIERLIRQRVADGASIEFAVYAGDDTTDLDAFAALDRLVESGELAAAMKVAVESSESPKALQDSADLVVGGTPGIGDLLKRLASPAREGR